MDVAGAAAGIDGALRAAGTPERAVKEAAYLRSRVHHYGASVPAARAAVRAVVKAHPDLAHGDLIALVTQLWDEPADRPVHERRLAAALLLAQRHDLIDLGDVPLIERMIRSARTWALVDLLAGDAAGPGLEGRDQGAVTSVLDRWAGDQDFWLRRSALLVHQRPLRAGAGDWERFTRYADAMLEEREFFVRKAIGWMLREAARRRPELVFGWVLPRAHRASTVTLNEAIRHLAPDQRAAVLARRR